MAQSASNIKLATTSRDEHNEQNDFLRFRLHYLIVHIAIMLADGLQGTHLYVLYESYGYSVASLYSLGFLSGALTAPFTGPVVDYIGRKNSALLYCVLEIFINTLELYDNLGGLITSRMIGGITTNLLFTVFESWFITEHRKRNFSEHKLEVIMRDSVIASNLSAIASGCIAHVLAGEYGNVGPFKGAVVLTFVALLLVTTWQENYGSCNSKDRRMTDYMSKSSAMSLSFLSIRFKFVQVVYWHCIQFNSVTCISISNIISALICIVSPFRGGRSDHCVRLEDIPYWSYSGAHRGRTSNFCVFMESCSTSLCTLAIKFRCRWYN